MGTVCKYSHEDWLTMKMLKGAVNFMQERNKNGEFSISIKMERDLLKDYINGKAA